MRLHDCNIIMVIMVVLYNMSKYRKLKLFILTFIFKQKNLRKLQCNCNLTKSRINYI